MTDLRVGGEGRIIVAGYELGRGTVGGLVPGMGGITGVRRGFVLKFVEGGNDIIRHGNVNVFVGAGIPKYLEPIGLTATV